METIASNGTAPNTTTPNTTTVTPKHKVNITIKRSVYDIEIDMDKITWKDAKELRRQQVAIANGEMTEEQAFALSDALVEKVTGRKPDELPMEVVQQIMTVLYSDDAEAAAAQGN